MTATAALLFVLDLLVWGRGRDLMGSDMREGIGEQRRMREEVGKEA